MGTGDLGLEVMGKRGVVELCMARKCVPEGVV